METDRKELKNILDKFIGKIVFVQIEKWNSWNNVNKYNKFKYVIDADNIEIYDENYSSFCFDINGIKKFKDFGSNVRINLNDMMIWIVEE